MTCYKQILGGEGHDGIWTHTRCRNLQHSADRNMEASGVLEMKMMLPLQDRKQWIYNMNPPVALSFDYHNNLIFVSIR